MSNRSSFVAAALFSGFLFWSWGGIAGWRTMQMLGYPGYQAAIKASAKPPKRPARVEPEKRLELSRRLEAAVKAPETITSDDLAAVQTSFGKEAATMLKTLRDAAR